VKTWHRPGAAGRPGEVRLGCADARLWPRVARSPAVPARACHPRRPAPLRRPRLWRRFSKFSVATKVQPFKPNRISSFERANFGAAWPGRFRIVSVRGTKQEGQQKSASNSSTFCPTKKVLLLLLITRSAVRARPGEPLNQLVTPTSRLMAPTNPLHCHSCCHSRS
jgi:hypothetical protein